MIYGANGYTGELIARMAAAMGDTPLLAGRSAAAIEKLATELGLDYRILDLNDEIDLEHALTSVDVVAYCAGPFSATAAPMVAACLAAGTDYVDLTGEIDVFEAIYACHDAARAARITLVPGVGFDVVPSDHLVATLVADFPDATEADIAVVSRGGFSAGTLKAALEGLVLGNTIRINGALATVPSCHASRTIPLSTGDTTVLSAPLGDVSSAYRAYGIGTITTFTEFGSPRSTKAGARVLGRAFAWSPVRAAGMKLLSKTIAGPDDHTRENTRSEAWAELRDSTGRCVSGSLTVSNTYDFTARSTIHAVHRLMAGGIPYGAWSPSQAFGRDFLTTIPGANVQRGPVQGRSGR
ncbi:saccharopine dehydrogenase NADP-binding domain-containing protein [Hoyosella rhizosphaerae]|uniref:Saccharopine dehydrogenase NADP binding domain-containing protein n=2 Tax=Hoyosella rhizosphaerae TaxID=1755582 RepID=A0A916TZM3_9ACTN|nr:saccharopine dehydrogenase NADP-binding domain-containing protein [Hoyosella rhizosphaerae]GGC54460.1 hypothetical protein GCM10011410_03540 [Hoyosella rhizosphaerae]